MIRQDSEAASYYWPAVGLSRSASVPARMIEKKKKKKKIFGHATMPAAGRVLGANARDGNDEVWLWQDAVQRGLITESETMRELKKKGRQAEQCVV